MKPRSELANNLANESEAYGYTLSVWGAGALLIDAYGVPSILGITAYLGGALAGFATLVAVAFGGVLDTTRVETSNSPLVVSTVHVVSTGGSLAVASGVIRFSLVPPLLTFLLVGFSVTVTYNLLLLAEELLAHFLDGRKESR
jgi:hypothetical protein